MVTFSPTARARFPSTAVEATGVFCSFKKNGVFVDLPVWMVGVNIYPKENDLPLPFAPTNICSLECLDGGVNVDVDERGRAEPTTNLL
jgi:hypothetical protein